MRHAWDKLYDSTGFRGKTLGDLISLLAIPLVGVAVGTLIIVVNIAFGTAFFEDNISRDQTQTLEERIAILSSNLEQSSQAISEIEAEIAQRHQLVVQLEQQRQTTENLLRLNREEVESVAQLIRGEVRANQRQSFWVNVGTSAFFFVLGLISPSISRAVTRRLRKEKQG